MASYSTFVVRIHFDTELKEILEGQITHVSSQESKYFRDLNEAVIFMLAHLKDSTQPGDSDSNAGG